MDFATWFHLGPMFVAEAILADRLVKAADHAGHLYCAKLIQPRLDERIPIACDVEEQTEVQPWQPW